MSFQDELYLEQVQADMLLSFRDQYSELTSMKKAQKGSSQARGCNQQPPGIFRGQIHRLPFETYAASSILAIPDFLVPTHNRPAVSPARKKSCVKWA